MSADVVEPAVTSSPVVAEAKVESTESKTPSKTVAFDPDKNVDIAPKTPLTRLFSELPSIIKQASYQEIWGVELSPTDESHVPTSIVLEKFLRANTYDVNKAKSQLTEALAWRKHMQPLKLLTDTEFNQDKFGNLGYVSSYSKTGGGKEIVTWNIYGGVKSFQNTFGNIEEFIQWRCALMELSLRELDLAHATEPIPTDGVDPYRMVQVHDYLNVSFLRMDPAVRAASKEVIATFSMAYPELLSEKFFVNVPVLMGFVFTAMKVFLAPATIKKFHPLSYGSSLAGELPGFGESLPKVYGGKGADLDAEGLTVKYSAKSKDETPAKEVEA